MARPFKQGLNYFPVDIDIFDDDKISLITSEFGAVGESILIRLLCKIYKNGYYYKWGGDECSLFCKWAGAIFVPNQVNEVLAGLLRRSIFDNRVFESFGILTSVGIQKRYLQAAYQRRNLEIIPEIWLIDLPDNYIECPVGSVIHTNNYSYSHEKLIENKTETEKNSNSDEKQTSSGVIHTNNGVIHTNNSQSKVKKSKVKKSKDDDNNSTSPSSEFSLSVNYQNKQPIKTLIDQLKAEDYFCEHCMRENSISTRDELNNYLERFKNHLIAIDETQKTLKDCKLHFMNWLRINKNIEANNGTTQNKYETATKLDEPVPEIFYEKVKKLYPQNNFYSVKLFDQYMEYHSYTPEQALKHFERAYLEKMSFPILILRVQSERVKLFKD